jgi:hypothetical protein
VRCVWVWMMEARADGGAPADGEAPLGATATPAAATTPKLGSSADAWLSMGRLIGVRDGVPWGVVFG